MIPAFCLRDDIMTRKATLGVDHQSWLVDVLQTAEVSRHTGGFDGALTFRRLTQDTGSWRDGMTLAGGPDSGTR